MKTHLPQKNFSLLDLVPITLSIIVCALLFLFLVKPESNDYAIIKTDTSEKKVNLKNDCELNVKSGGYEYIIIISDGNIYVESANCPDNTCVSMGKIGKAKNGSVICPPGKLIIRLTEEAEGENADVIVP